MFFNFTCFYLNKKILLMNDYKFEIIYSYKEIHKLWKNKLSKYKFIKKKKFFFYFCFFYKEKLIS